MSFTAKKTPASLPIVPVNGAKFAEWIQKQDSRTRSWVEASGYKGALGSILNIHDAEGRVLRVLFGVDNDDSLYTYAALPGLLPKHDGGYFIDKKMTPARATQAALGWALGSYQFTKYKSSGPRTFASLVWPDNADRAAVNRTAEAMYLVRDLVNTPSNDLGPEELANAAENLLGEKADIEIIEGKDLIKKNYPAIYEVGKGSPRAPRLIDIRWGNPKNPRVTVIGKGVVFDTGGLNLKLGSGMFLMKKDMGGAAHAVGLAHMIVAAKLPVCLRVLIPVVENAIDGNSFRPSDIIKTRKGISVEIGDTDAEGRLILADALAEGSNENPALMIDFATLTGAARVALGPDLPAMFCNDEKLAQEMLTSSTQTQDPVWRLPLWQPYKDFLNCKTADTSNISTGGMGGTITAALFLEKFVGKGVPWIHLDTFAWTQGNRPGRPEGGDALGMRAAFDLIEKKFGKKKA